MVCPPRSNVESNTRLRLPVSPAPAVSPKPITTKQLSTLKGSSVAAAAPWNYVRNVADAILSTTAMIVGYTCTRQMMV